MGELVTSDLYDLQLVEATCSEQGLSYTRMGDQIEVTIAPGLILLIANSEDATDTYLGFRDIPWHSHGRLILMTGESTFVEYGPSEVLVGLTSGHLVIVTQYLKGQIEDRWLAHRDEKMDLRHIEPGEELRIYRACS